mgnify:CR=1 FL=1
MSAATSPAYSLAAVLGPIVALVGVHAPGVLLASFVPMLLIAGAFAALNRVDPDCGTTFSWVTRALGPWTGWIGGWAIAMTGVLVLGSLAEVGVRFTLLAAGLVGINIAAPGVGAIITIFLAGLAIAAAAIVWLSLLVRKALLLVAIVLGALLYGDRSSRAA